MMIFVLTTAFLVAAFSWQSLARERQHLGHFLLSLERLEEASRSGAVSYAKGCAESGERNMRRVAGLLESARRRGLPGLETLSYVQTLGMKTADFGRQKARLWKLLVCKVFIAVSVAACARMVLLFTTEDISLELLGYDRLALIFAGLALAGTLLFLHKALPSSWFWQRALTLQACDWMAGHLLLSLPRDLRLSSQLYVLYQRELRLGISLSHVKRRTLESYAAAWTGREQEQLERLVETLPLLELLGGGLSALLILLCPLLAVLK